MLSEDDQVLNIDDWIDGYLIYVPISKPTRAVRAKEQ